MLILPPSPTGKRLTFADALLTGWTLGLGPGHAEAALAKGHLESLDDVRDRSSGFS